jgi:hypothetical protein
MNNTFTLLFIVAVIVGLIFYSQQNETFVADYPYSDLQKTEECAKWNGVVIQENGELLCWLPSTIQNDAKLNFQLAGRKCHIPTMIESQSCITPGLYIPPQAQSASRGNFHYNI